MLTFEMYFAFFGKLAFARPFIPKTEICLAWRLHRGQRSR